MEEFFRRAREASGELLGLKSGEKSQILREMAQLIQSEWGTIVEANRKDMEYAEEANLSSALKDRLYLDRQRVEAMAQAVREIAALKEPVGRVLDGWEIENGLRIEKVSIPIGVIGIIYESRPNVTSDAAALCFKSSNVAILKGGKEAKHSNEAIASLLQWVLERHGLPREVIALLPDYSREGVERLIKMDRYIDLIIPRGGEALIKYVSQNATVPVVKHDKGLCHTYIDRDADFEKAVKIALNAKVQRPGVCNAMETLLVDYAIKDEILLPLYNAFKPYETLLKGCSLTREVVDVAPAEEEDFQTEYLDNILSIKVVDGVEGAIDHIRRYGSGHSEAIVTENYTTAEKFLNGVDAACVYLNASTRFTDGGIFGFGAEVGISTNKLHARGPMGINDLTTYKYRIYGNGQIRQ